ncbi:hypothetical protein, partial [Phytoactinopolyspora endophytica]|uniref:hypothetical protein n=1 Tax=Phytoactinopolyspora endophytica TaxID=1642495 RepID=UPI0013EAFD8F
MVAALAAAALPLSATAVALPPDGDGDEDGYSVEVEVLYSGDGAPEGGGSYYEYVEPLCYWGPFKGAGGPDVGDGTDMEKVL